MTNKDEAMKAVDRIMKDTKEPHLKKMREKSLFSLGWDISQNKIEFPQKEIYHYFLRSNPSHEAFNCVQNFLDGYNDGLRDRKSRELSRIRLQHDQKNLERKAQQLER
jgi:hypothetical protein